jgi:adenylate kinase
MVDRILKRGQESGRSDDTEDVARRRIRTFHDQGEPTLDCLAEFGIPVFKVDGTGSRNETWLSVLSLDTPVTRRVL